jgi:multidrug efflux pump subunit AcrB
VDFCHNHTRRVVTVYANVDNEEATAFGVNTALEAQFADVSLRHPEVELEFGGEYEVTRETMQNLFAAFPVALLLIYGVLAALFRSYLQPLVVATAIPLGMIGVIVGTAVLDYKLSMAIMYGAIGLTGVVVNDSLVMVDFINRARAEGMSLLEAVRQSGARRLRPILLTTLTTVFALLPMALGLHGGSRSFGPLAASLAFGLMFAMLGTLFIVPLCYTLLIRAQDRMNGRLRSPRGGGESPAIPDAPATR